MKKFALALGLGAVLTAGTCLASPVDQINTNIANALSPLQNSNTLAQITFKDLKTNEEHLKHASLNALFHKTGSQNTFKITIDELSYNSLKKPFVNFSGALDLDFSKIYPKRERDKFVSEVSNLFYDLVKSMVGYRNRAASIERHVSSYTKDEEGHLTDVNIIIIAHANLDKLSGQVIEDIPASDIILSYSINLKTGIKIHVFGAINEDSRAFKNTDADLKTLTDFLINGEEIVLNALKGMVGELDAIASEIVEFSTLNKVLPLLQKRAA